MRLIVIGGGAGGMSAAAQARRSAPNLEILVLEQSADVSVGLCGLPYFIGDAVKEANRLILHTPEYFRAKRQIDVRPLHRVESILPAPRIVTGRNLVTGEPFELKYDRLIVATGAVAAAAGVPGENSPHVFTVRTLADGIRLKARLEARTARTAAVVGGGYIGLELAEALRRWDLQVTVLEAGNQVLPGFAPQVAEAAVAELARQGIRCLTGQTVTGIEQGAVTTRESGPIPADLVVVATGARPEVELAKRAGGETGNSGALAVGRQMQTTLPSVWAAGDCAESKSAVTGRPFHLPLGSVANLHGCFAGEAAAGHRLEAPPLAGTQMLQLFDLALARTGLTEPQARVQGYSPVTADLTGSVRAHIFEENGEFQVRLLADSRTGRLLGGEIAGHRESVRRIDVIGALLVKGASVDEVAGLDMGYTPPLGTARDPLVQTAQRLTEALAAARRRLF